MSLSSSRFFFKKTRRSTWSEPRQDLVAVTISPAVENTLSDATDVACTQRKILEHLASIGYFPEFRFQKCNGSAVGVSLGSNLYIEISVWTCSKREVLAQLW